MPDVREARLYVVGQRQDGSYQAFHLDCVPDGDGIDSAEQACRRFRLKYIHCSRHKEVK